VGALACKQCGSDDRAGWAGEDETVGLDLPEPLSDEEYDEVVEREVGEAAAPRASLPLRTRLIGLALVALLLVGTLLLLW
jgi:hypothetical protein